MADRAGEAIKARGVISTHGLVRLSVITIAFVSAGIGIGIINFQAVPPAAIPHWGAWVPAWLQGLFAVAQVGVTIWVALEINSRTRVEYQRDLSKSWQDFNLAILTEENAHRIVSAARYGMKTPEPSVPELIENGQASEIELETLMNFRLNLLHQLWTAERAGMIDDDYSAPIWRHYLPQIYETNKALFLGCCCEQKGYDQRFVRDIRQRLSCPAST